MGESNELRMKLFPWFVSTVVDLGTTVTIVISSLTKRVHRKLERNNYFHEKRRCNKEWRKNNLAHGCLLNARIRVKLGQLRILVAPQTVL